MLVALWRRDTKCFELNVELKRKFKELYAVFFTNDTNDTFPDQNSPSELFLNYGEQTLQHYVPWAQQV